MEVAYTTLENTILTHIGVLKKAENFEWAQAKMGLSNKSRL